MVFILHYQILMLHCLMWMLLTVPEQLPVTVGCQPGWFGNGCMYKCHCATSELCDDDGKCPGIEVCMVGFFGPGCQYVDLASTFGTNSTHAYLRDSNDNTCNPQSDAVAVEVELQTPLPFLGFNIHVDDNWALYSFTVMINDERPCDNQRRFPINERAVQVTCDTNILLSNLRIEGKIASTVCSVYINGGRNVALKQSASHDHYSPGLMHAASNAVDGNTEGNFMQGSCAHTAQVYSGAEWSLKYNRPHIVIRVNVYSTTSYSHGLQGFYLRTFSKDANQTNYYHDSNYTSLRMHSVILPSRIPITSLIIKGSPFVPIKQRFLTICEVETYGEVLCPDMSYGLSCSGQCKCDIRTNEICDTVTGFCGQGCNRGWYGYNCSNICSENCRNGVCFQNYGYCLNCNPGYLGPYCSRACHPGTFGQSCLLECSPHCSNVCNHESGYCQCQPSYIGAQCTACRSGFYGINCSQSCSKVCQKLVCHIETGECMSCVGDRVGAYCQDCPEKMYGAMCYSKCSKYCLHGTCDKVTGYCSVCTYGYTGDKCQFMRTKENIPWSYIILTLLISLILVVICFNYLLNEIEYGDST